MISKDIKKHEETKRSYAICSADKFWLVEGVYMFDFTRLGEAHKSCQRAFKDALDNNIEIVYVDNTNLTQKDRSYYYNESFRHQDCEILVRVFHVDVELSIKRNIHNVPETTILSMAKKIDLSPGLYSVSGLDGVYSHHRIGDLQ